ncbi:MAG: hypothetical protein M1819_006377 [Sarea resinae]|nr:MAG: hypothetical protein M1819_006377 [Sarea resinae]
MSKLSAPLKGLIKAPFAKPDTTTAPSNIRSVYEKIAHEASSKNVGLPYWLTISTAATMTMNSPNALTELYRLATSSKGNKESASTAEFMREIGLKCISFNGIPRTINCLGPFRASLPGDVVQSLSTKTTRVPTKENIDEIKDRGDKLWQSIYVPFDEKLTAKLGESHPDLPIYIISYHYGALLADPDRGDLPKVDRVLTSVVAVACLRAQTGVGPQVTSHLFGLRKAFEQGTGLEPAEKEDQGARWLASNEGSIWILETVDKIVEAIGQGQGTTFAPGIRSKL